MNVLSVNVGVPREVPHDGGTVRTSIFRTPVSGRVRVHELGLEGNESADLEVHGGISKAVYVYPSEHYTFWWTHLGVPNLPWGAFGENLTTEGILEEEVCAGDRLRIGTVEFAVTQPRMPCYKLGVRHHRPSIVREFLQSRRSGFYLAVITPGHIERGDTIHHTWRSPHGLTIPELVDLYVGDTPPVDRLRIAAAIPELSESWRTRFQERIAAQE